MDSVGNHKILLDKIVNYQNLIIDEVIDIKQLNLLKILNKVIYMAMELTMKLQENFNNKKVETKVVNV